jgi:hypothetical protein
LIIDADGNSVVLTLGGGDNSDVPNGSEGRMRANIRGRFA